MNRIIFLLDPDIDHLDAVLMGQATLVTRKMSVLPNPGEKDSAAGWPPR